MPAIKDWLANASRQLLDVGVPSANLDAEIILANAMSKDRTYLHSRTEQIIDTDQIKQADAGLNLRIKRVPIAYIIGHKEFYGRPFITTPAVLIPRPESEAIIDLLKQIPISHFPTPNPRLVDVGTGSGILGITAKLEFPNLNVTLTDVSADALQIAQQNAIKLSVDVPVIQSDLLQNYTEKPDIIIANLPYVDKVWERSTETHFEPDLALFADNHGLALIEKLIVQANKLLDQNGYLVLEADPVQHESIIEYANNQSFDLVQKLDYAVALRRR